MLLLLLFLEDRDRECPRSRRGFSGGRYGSSSLPAYLATTINLIPPNSKKGLAQTLPAGITKDPVLGFLRSKHALYYDDLAARVEARPLGDVHDQLHMLNRVTLVFDQRMP